MKRMVLVTLASSALSALVVGNVYCQKRQFYSTVTYLLNSNRTLGVLYIEAAVMLWVITTLVKKLFFGTLRAAEVEHLVEKSWYMVLETFILLAGFHEDMQFGFVATITFLFVVKAFHWLIEERINYMERSPLITWTFHLRALSILALLAAIDYLYIKYSWNSLRAKASVQIVFGLEYTIMLLLATNTFFHYLLHSIDLRSEDPWENKAIYMRYVDIAIGFLKLCLYIGYMVFMMWILFIPLHIARRIFITAKHFQKSVHEVISSHQAIRNLNTLYPDATEEELREANTVCIICREDMLQNCKKLPCKHIFHTSCLRSWFQRQQVCPTCRMDVLSHSAALRRNNRRQTQPPQPQGPRGMFPPGVPPGLFNPMMAPPPHIWPHPPPGMAPPQPAPNPPPEGANIQTPTAPAADGNRAGGDGGDAVGAADTGGREGSGNLSQQAQTHTSPPPPPPTLPGFTPFTMPPPMFGMMQPPFDGIPGGAPSLDGLTVEQLRSLEGMERANVEARVELLRNIQRLLDLAVVQMAQYSAVMATLGSTAGPGFPGHPYPPGTSPPDSQSSQPPPATSAQQSPPPASSTPPRTAPRQLVEGGREFSFSTSQLSPQRARDKTEERGKREGGGERGLFTVGESPTSSGDRATEAGGEEDSSEVDGSPSNMDELRQRRLQRFHSMPAVSSAVAAGTAETGKSDANQSSAKEQ